MGLASILFPARGAASLGVFRETANNESASGAAGRCWSKIGINPGRILIAVPQAGNLGGTLIARLQAGAGSCARLFGNCFLRPFIKHLEQPGRCLCVSLVLPVWLPLVHERKTTTGQGEACSKNRTMRFTA